MTNLRLQFQPKQRELLDLVETGKASWIGYGGSRGGGKSAAARRAMLARRFSHPGTWGLIFRRVYDDLKRNHIDKFFEEFPELRQYYRASDHEIQLPNGSKIIFAYAETKEELKRKFHGPEYMDIFVDQAEQLTEEELRLFKLANRWPGMSDDMCKFVLFFNPGGVGLQFLKRIFGDREYIGNERESDFAFVQAYGWDNVEWVRKSLEYDGLRPKDFYAWDDKRRFKYFISRSQYGQELDSLPEALRKGHLLGSFDTFAGQYFAGVWNPEKMVVPVERGLGLIKSWWPRWIGMDWGFAHHSVATWNATGRVTAKELQDMGYDVTTEQEVVLTYRVMAVAETPERVLAQQVVDRCTKQEKESIRRVFLSPDAFAKKTSANTIAQEIGDVLAAGGLPRPEMADNDRVGGWRLMYNLMKETWDVPLAA